MQGKKAWIQKSKDWRVRVVRVFGTGEHPDVPSFRCLVPGNKRMFPRSGFWYQGTSAKTSLRKPPFGNPELRRFLSKKHHFLRFFGGILNSLVIRIATKCLRTHTFRHLNFVLARIKEYVENHVTQSYFFLDTYFEY